MNVRDILTIVATGVTPDTWAGLTGQDKDKDKDKDEDK